MLNAKEEGCAECGLPPGEGMFEGIKAVGFDLDGTYLNTHVDYDRINRADRDACIRHGIPFDELSFTTIKRLRAPIREWLEAHGRGDEFEALGKEIDAELTATELQYIHEAKAFPGSIECVRELKSRGYKVGLLTRGSHEYGVKALTMMGVIDCTTERSMGAVMVMAVRKVICGMTSPNMAAPAMRNRSTAGTFSRRVKRPNNQKRMPAQRARSVKRTIGDNSP